MRAPVPAGAGSDRAAVRTGTARRRTGRLAAIAASIVLLAAVGVAGWYLTRDPDQRTRRSGQLRIRRKSALRHRRSVRQSVEDLDG